MDHVSLLHLKSPQKCVPVWATSEKRVVVEKNEERLHGNDDDGGSNRVIRNFKVSNQMI
jgi:hypothetical protein